MNITRPSRDTNATLARNPASGVMVAIFSVQRSAGLVATSREIAKSQALFTASAILERRNLVRRFLMNVVSARLVILAGLDYFAKILVQQTARTGQKASAHVVESAMHARMAFMRRTAL